MDHKFERELAPVRADLLLVKWMLGLVLGGILALIIKTFFRLSANAGVGVRRMVGMDRGDWNVARGDVARIVES